MESVARSYLLYTIVVIALVCMVQFLISDSMVDMILTLVLMLCGFTVLVLGAYMYLEARGGQYVNGVDWWSMTESEVRNLTSYWGLFFMIGSILLMIAVATLMSNLVIGILLILVSVAFLLIPIALKEKGKVHVYTEKSKGYKVAVLLTASLVAIVPSIYLLNSDFSSEAIQIEFGDDSFRIQAPMVDKTFDYSKVEDLGIDPNFDKGSRVWGYATTKICSGTFNNAVFGNYTLASFVDVKPCVFFTYEGKYYAFNQSSVELTQAAFDRLAELVGP